MGLSSCKITFPDIIIIEPIVCIIKCKVLCNINDAKRITMAMKIQNGHFASHYALDDWIVLVSTLTGTGCNHPEAE